jgi:hypothetical protein
MLMQPTPAQRRETRLRDVAAKRGLRVHFQPVPKGCDHSNGANKQAITYCLPWKQQADIRNVWVLIRKTFSHDLHAMGRWDWLMPPGAVPADFAQQLNPLVDELPDFVYAISSGPQGLCCFWNELGSEEHVNALADWLENTASKITLEN